MVSFDTFPMTAKEPYSSGIDDARLIVPLLQ